MLERLFDWYLRHRLLGALGVLALTAVMALGAARVRPDYSVEHLFPKWDSARATYDEFKARFPYEDARALVLVEAPDLYTPEGMARLAELEESLRHVANVIDVEGPLSTNDIVNEDDWVAIRPLFSISDSADVIEAKRRYAEQDGMFAWNLVQPGGTAATIAVSMTPESSQADVTRQRLLADLERVVAEHDDGMSIRLSGIPVIRAEFARLIQKDTGLLIPAALGVILLLLVLAFRRPVLVAAGFGTIVVALIWAYGVMGWLGYPITALSAVMPIVVMIISISDTVHIITDYVRGNSPGRAGIVHAMSQTAIPCLLTEIVLACGFLSLLAVNIVAVVELGIVASAAMLLTWLSNMLVLPLLMSLHRPRRANEAAAAGAEAPPTVRMLSALVDGIAGIVTRRPGRVALVAAAVLAAGALLGTRTRQLSFAFDDLRPDAALTGSLRYAESVHGGLVPVAIYIVAEEKDADNPALEPRRVRLADEAATLLERFPEVAQATSIADPLRKTHGILAGEDAAGPLPGTRSLAVQEVSLFDDGRILRDLVSFDRRALAVIGYAKDVGSARTEEMFREIDAWVAMQQQRLAAEGDPTRIEVTGQLRIFKDVNDSLVTGLSLSLGLAVLVTLAVFSIVLRSWRLGLIGIIPNVSPLLLVLAFMTLTGMTLKPSTVILFSITLVIADDDTIQFLARYKRHYRQALDRLGASDLRAVHQLASRSCMQEVGVPMLVMSSCVSSGFLLCMLSQFQGLANLGVLIAATLFAAVFADLFLMPLLFSWFKPRLH